VQEISGIPKIANRNYDFLTLQKSEFQKKNPTKIFGIVNEIGIPPPMGVPEIGTKNRNSHPSQNGQVPQLLSTDSYCMCPFRVRDILIPTETIGYVYIIISKCDANFTYIGESLNISQRLAIHNSGHGAVDTACVSPCPYALAGLISCVGLEKNVRLGLEQNWRVL
jgi:hypothetical protein